jgi:pimeloyl-ACP methyl ester carboxylesterase
VITSKTVELPQGTIRYRDLGEGEPFVFVHGYLVDGRLWSGVADRLAASGGHRCLVPDWPMGSHRTAMSPDADLSPPGFARLIAEFLDALGLDQATIVGNDSGGAMSQVFTAEYPDRVRRLVLTNCDTFEHFPPFPFTALPRLARIPGTIGALALPLRLGPVARAAYRPFTREPLPADLIESWVAPAAHDADVRRDTRKLTIGMHKRYTIEAAEKLRSFERPVRFVWGVEDRLFKLSHAERLAAIVPDAEIAEIADAKTFSPLDQPEAVADAIAKLAGDRTTEAVG